MPVLQIQLLGEFRLSYGDYPVTGLDSPRLQELLAFLVLHCDAPQSRQHLAFLLWPDSTEPQAHTNLRNLYHRLLRALPDSARFLTASTTSLRWQTDSPYALDVAEFESELSHAATADELAAAAHLYRGELLPGCYSDWVLSERERLRLALAEALSRLIDLLSERQDYRAAIGYAQELLRSDPLREETYRDLMRLSGLNGDRAGVARFFNKCKTVLRRELDVEPSPETQAAYATWLAEAGTPRAASRPAISPFHSRRDNLPLELSRFFGREEELPSIEHLLTENRLVTLTGAAGVGKTRLALAVAERLVESFPDGVWVVDLAPLTDPDHVPIALASALGVREMPGQALNDKLADYLQGRKLMILFDNCEHLVRAAASLVEICLLAAPESRIMATSREVLGIDGEHVWRVSPLPIPDSVLYEPRGPGEGMASVQGKRIVSRLLECASVQLFVDRASNTLPSFVLSNENAPVVAQICRRLDGIPLAIELAAGRINIMTAEEIKARLDDAIGFLAGGSPRAILHHRTLRAAIDWTYETLSEKEQRLLRRLAIFAGGFTVHAAEQVASDPTLLLAEVLDLLSGLADKSLVTVEGHGGESRLRLLEPIRQYAHEKLVAAGEEGEVRKRHLDFFLELAEELNANSYGADQALVLQPLEQEHDNFRAALNWSESADPERGLQLAVSLTGLFEWHGHTIEGRRWIEKLLKLNERAQPAVRAEAMFAISGSAFFQGDVETARALLEASLQIHRELGDVRAIATTLSRLGAIACACREFALARAILEESLEISQARGDAGTALLARVYLGFAICHLNERAQGQLLMEQCLGLGREWGAPAFVGVALLLLGLVACEEGDYAVAHPRYLEVLTLSREADLAPGLVYAFDALAVATVGEGRFRLAAQLFGAGARLSSDKGTPLWPLLQSGHDRGIAGASAALGGEDFASAWAEGYNMREGEAFDLALS